MPLATAATSAMAATMVPTFFVPLSRVLVRQHQQDDGSERNGGDDHAQVGLHPVGQLVLLGGRREVVRALPQLRAYDHQNQVDHEEDDEPRGRRRAGQEQRAVHHEHGHDLAHDAQHPQHRGADAEGKRRPVAGHVHLLAHGLVGLGARAALARVRDGLAGLGVDERALLRLLLGGMLRRRLGRRGFILGCRLLFGCGLRCGLLRLRLRSGLRGLRFPCGLFVVLPRCHTIPVSLRFKRWLNWAFARVLACTPL